VDTLHCVCTHFPPNTPVTIPTVHQFHSIRHAVMMDDASSPCCSKWHSLQDASCPCMVQYLEKCDFLHTLHPCWRDNDHVGGLHKTFGGNTPRQELSSLQCMTGRAIGHSSVQCWVPSCLACQRIVMVEALAEWHAVQTLRISLLLSLCLWYFFCTFLYFLSYSTFGRWFTFLSNSKSTKKSVGLGFFLLFLLFLEKA